MGQPVDDLRRAGKLISSAGLRSTAEGLRLKLRGGRISMRDGPSGETRKLSGGDAMRNAGVHTDDRDFECRLQRLDGPGFGRQP